MPKHECPDCGTTDVESWTHDPVGKPGEYRVIDCNKCDGTFEKPL